MADMNGEIRGQVFRGSEFTAKGAGMDDLSKDATYRVHPTPLSNAIVISKERFTATEIINLAVVTRKTVKTIALTSNGQSVDVSDLKSGIYFLKDGFK
jgi:hypothetical protein